MVDDPARGGGAPPSVPRFLADAMLGRLARWLRYLGYDTVYDAEHSDDVLARRALAEGRVLLTRDRGLVERWRPPEAVLVRGDRPSDQLRQVARERHLDLRSRRRPRCTICNGALETSEPAPDEHGVPAYVRRTHAGSFTRCADCGRFYWPGTHAERMERVLAALFAER